MEEKVVKTFRRGLLDTVIGLAHIGAGFFSFVWSLARIYVIGWKVVFEYGTGIGVFNYAFEATSLILWVSGIGILRGRKWGKITGAVWAVCVIVMHMMIYYIRKGNWGLLAPAPGWSDFIIIYYAVFFLILQAINPLASLAAKKFNFDFSFMNIFNSVKRIKYFLRLSK